MLMNVTTKVPFVQKCVLLSSLKLERCFHINVN